MVPHFHTPQAVPALGLPFPHGRRYVPIQHIVRLEGDQNYTRCHFSDGSTLTVARTLKKLLGRLPENALMRLHRKHAVNPGYVAEWNLAGHFVRLRTGEQLDIARRRSGPLRQRRLRG